MHSLYIVTTVYVNLLVSGAKPPSGRNGWFSIFVMGTVHTVILYIYNFACALSCLPTMRSIPLVYMCVTVLPKHLICDAVLSLCWMWDGKYMFILFLTDRPLLQPSLILQHLILIYHLQCTYMYIRMYKLCTKMSPEKSLQWRMHVICVHVYMWNVHVPCRWCPHGTWQVKTESKMLHETHNSCQAQHGLQQDEWRVPTHIMCM